LELAVNTTTPVSDDDFPDQDSQAIRDGIARGELAIAQGNTSTHAQAKARMARWLSGPPQALIGRQES